MSEAVLYAEDMVIKNEVLYAICRDMAFIYASDLHTGKVVEIIPLPDEKISLRQSSRRLIIVGNIIVVIPYNAKKVYLYDLDKKEWIKSIQVCDTGICEKFIEAFEIDNKIFMIGACAPTVIILDTQSWEYTEIKNVFNKFNNPKDLFCRNCHVVIEDNIYIPITLASYILKINYKNLSYEYIELNNNDVGFSGIAFDGKDLWLSPRRDGVVLKIDKNSKSEIVNLPFTLMKSRCNFGGIYLYNNKIILQGFEGQYSAEIDIESNEVSYDTSQYYFYKVIENNIISQQKDGFVNYINNDTNTKYKISVDTNTLSDSLKDKRIADIKNGLIQTENEYFNLNHFMQLILDEK